MTRRAAVVVSVLAVMMTACVPTAREQLTINADGTGELTVTWFITREQYEEPGFLDDESGASRLEWSELQELVTDGVPTGGVEAIAGIENYRPPPRAELEAIREEDRLAIRYTERFNSLSQLASWSRASTTGELLPADLESGRLSVLALWGLEVDRRDESTTLTIDAADHWRRYLDRKFGDQGVPNEGIRLEMVISIEGEVERHNATRVAGDRYIWEPTLADLSPIEPITITWTPPAVESDDGIDNRTVALGLLGIGAFIVLVHLLRWRRQRAISRSLWLQSDARSPGPPDRS